MKIFINIMKLVNIKNKLNESKAQNDQKLYDRLGFP